MLDKNSLFFFHPFELAKNTKIFLYFTVICFMVLLGALFFFLQLLIIVFKKNNGKKNEPILSNDQILQFIQTLVIREIKTVKVKNKTTVFFHLITYQYLYLLFLSHCARCKKLDSSPQIGGVHFTQGPRIKDVPQTICPK